MVRNGRDPSNLRKAAREKAVNRREVKHREEAGLPPLDSFESVAREWYAKHSPSWASTHAEDHPSSRARRVPMDRKEADQDDRPADVLEILKRVEEREAYETTHRVQQN